MTDKLPDEILSEILCPALKVPDHLFSDTAPKSPFASYSVSCSSTLLVCKSWLRVATQLLYAVVVLRSTAQAHALQSALQSNPTLGKFVRKLRVEGGYGKCMHQILHETPNFIDVFVSLRIHASDSTVGLVSGLSLINPIRLIIFDETHMPLKNKQVVELMTALEICAAKKWKKLNTIYFPYKYLTAARESFCTSICSSPTIKTLSFPVYLSPFGPYLIKLAQNLSLEAIQVRAQVTEDPQPAPTSKDTRLGQLLRWAHASDTKPTERSCEIKPCLPIDPMFHPMKSVPQPTVDFVWSRILFFAMLSLEQHPENIPGWRVPDKNVNSKRLQFLLVSKQFLRLGQPYLYRYPVFLDADVLSYAVLARPGFGRHVHHLDVRFEARTFPRRKRLTTVSPSVSLVSILPHSRNLTHHFGSDRQSMSWTTFIALSEAAGTTLQEFTGFHLTSNSHTIMHSPSIFRRFTALRSFTWKHDSRTTETPLFTAVVQYSAAALPKLEILELQSPEALTMFSKMSLPSLRRVIFEVYGDWDTGVLLRLRPHGAKIQHVEVRYTSLAKQPIFTLCPNMTTLVYRTEGDHDLGLKALGIGFKHAGGSIKDENHWAAFFQALDISCLPALREVASPWCHWPMTEFARYCEKRVGEMGGNIFGAGDQVDGHGGGGMASEAPDVSALVAAQYLRSEQFGPTLFAEFRDLDHVDLLLE
ncbi:hypothetical protein DFH07DRAFT_973298 [Mycena maculata]|uniref:F-box domain-containing protein n=1 Tax=Mycena maculata TaxID=230809 RepID=A0AAD7MIU4_9AGAR|nr:hypothetical protein DFH07DRAFT_973298 [Mycena maculata]